MVSFYTLSLLRPPPIFCTNLHWDPPTSRDAYSILRKYYGHANISLQEWQKKLSALKVAQLPWDPPPAPTIKEQPTVPSNVKSIPQTLPSNGTKIKTPPPPLPQAPSAPVVKSESHAPSFPVQHPPPQPYHAPSFQQGQPMTARDRAAMALHQTYGQRAGPQIAQLQSGGQSRVPPLPSATPNPNFIKQENATTGFDGIQDYSQELKHPSQFANTRQTDGADEVHDDWESEYARRKAFAAAHGEDSDHLIRAHIQARQQELESGGLLTPLDDHRIVNKATARRLKALVKSEGPVGNAETHSVTRAQGDAAGDEDDEEDEDAINSDLDDPDDLAAAEENGENTDQVMLCTYDKVQRVKNKWKCTLKDGILRVEGNE